MYSMVAIANITDCYCEKYVFGILQNIYAAITQAFPPSKSFIIIFYCDRMDYFLFICSVACQNHVLVGVTYVSL